VSENFIIKARQIYETRKNSPLFLRVADSFLASNDANEAKEIIEEGLKFYPDHPLALILLGRANQLEGNNEQADELIQRASKILNSKETYKYYKSKLNLPDKRFSLFDLSRGSFFVKSTDMNQNAEKSEEPAENKSNEVEDRLSEIADKMMNTRISKDENFSVPESKENNYKPDKSKLATETFANIFISQGQIDEAIKIFETLIERNPHKKEYYLEKIKEIQYR
jgi:tetratricopeptide (TPR) repeat protein